MTKLLSQSWKGTASLAKAFWLVFFLFGIILWFIISFIVSMAAPNMPPMAMHNVITAILFPYTLFSAICVWRCAKNSALFWNILAKIVIILAVIGGIVAILHVIGIM